MCCWHQVQEVFVGAHRWEKRTAQHEETVEHTNKRVKCGFQDDATTDSNNAGVLMD